MNEELIYKRMIEEMQLKKSVDTVPTYTPSNFWEQFVFYDNNAGTVRLYLHINNTWRSINCS